MCVFRGMLYVHMFMCVNMHTWKSERSLGCYLLPPHLFEKKVSYYPLPVPSSLIMSFWGLAYHLGTGVLALQMQAMLLCFCVGSGTSNSDPHACVANP